MVSCGVRVCSHATLPPRVPPSHIASGSKPWYLVHVCRLRPDSETVARETLPWWRSVSGMSYDTVNSRHFVKLASVMRKSTTFEFCICAIDVRIVLEREEVLPAAAADDRRAADARVAVDLLVALLEVDERADVEPAPEAESSPRYEPSCGGTRAAEVDERRVVGGAERVVRRRRTARWPPLPFVAHERAQDQLAVRVELRAGDVALPEAERVVADGCRVKLPAFDEAHGVEQARARGCRSSRS